MPGSPKRQKGIRRPQKAPNAPKSPPQKWSGKSPKRLVGSKPILGSRPFGGFVVNSEMVRKPQQAQKWAGKSPKKVREKPKWSGGGGGGGEGFTGNCVGPQPLTLDAQRLDRLDGQCGPCLTWAGVGVLFGYFLCFFLGIFFMVFRSADARVSQSVKQLVSQLVDSRPSSQSVSQSVSGQR